MEYSVPKTKSLKTELARKTRSYQPEKPILPFKLVGDKKDHPRLVHILNRLCQSEWGLGLLKTANEGGYTLGFAVTNSAIGVCDQEGKYITLNPHFSDDTLIGTLSHEARHAAWFVKGGDEKFGVENIKSEIIKFRAAEADAEVSNVTACFELYQKGDKGPYLEYRSKNPYVAQKFEEIVNQNNGVITNEAKTEAFKGWYDNIGIKNAYEQGYHVHHMQQAIREDKLDKYPYSKNITSEEEIARTCFNPDNSNYFVGDKSILGKGKFLDVTPRAKELFEKYFQLRKEKHGIAIDKTLKEIPVRQGSFFGVRARKTDHSIAVDATKYSAKRGSR